MYSKLARDVGICAYVIEVVEYALELHHLLLSKNNRFPVGKCNLRERYLNHILSASADWGKLGA
jgi:hypothetical protein